MAGGKDGCVYNALSQWMDEGGLWVDCTYFCGEWFMV